MHLFSARRPLIRALCILLLCAGLPVSASASDTQDVLFLSTPSPAPTMAPAPLPTEPPLHAPDTLSPIAAALPTALPIHADIVSADGKSSSFTRDTPVNMPAQAAYSDLAGVLTFRGGPYRQNAAYGFVNPQRKTLRVVWEKKIGAIDNWSGVGWNGQPAIVRWPDALRAQMNLHAAKQTPGLCEVIYAALDGNIYFLDLSDGAETRAPIRVGFPIKGSVSIDPRGIPLLYSGQGISRNGAKRGKIGLHIFNLLDQSELYLLNGRDKDARRAHGAFDSVPLVDAQSDTLLAAGENGLFYTLSLHTQYDAAQATLSIAPTRVAYRYRTGKTVGMENSPAVWGHFAYFADNGGYLQCVDLNTLTLVWGASVSDDTDATIALEPEANGHLALYTACEVDLRKKNAPAFLRRFNAQTGALDWEVAVPCAYDPDLNGGVLASPLIGKYAIDQLVLFHVAKLQTGGGALLALDKQTGETVWRQDFKHYGWSSPVAVYNARGDAWILLGDSGGNLRLLDGKTGQILDQLALEGNIEGSPAVFDDLLVIGTRGRRLYGIRIE